MRYTLLCANILNVGVLSIIKMFNKSFRKGVGLKSGVTKENGVLTVWGDIGLTIYKCVNLN